jgi:hypothetical protein
MISILNSFFKNIFFLFFFLIVLYCFLIFLGAIFFELDWIEVRIVWEYSHDYQKVDALFLNALTQHRLELNREILYPIRLLVFYNKESIFKFIELWSHVWMVKEDVISMTTELLTLLENLIEHYLYKK